MGYTNYTTERGKGQHLKLEESVLIETRLKDGWNIKYISRDITK